MIIWLYYYFTGYLVVEINGKSQERFINMCMHHKIKLWDLTSNYNKYQFKILRKDFKKLKPMLRKANIDIFILDRYGFPFFVFENRKRKMFLLGIFICSASLIFLSQLIWSIEISGNQLYTDEMITKFLNENKVEITMRSCDVDCDNIVALLRDEFTYITWASVHIDGCKIMITIKENEQIDRKDFYGEVNNLVLESAALQIQENENGMDIVAQEDGIISSIITRSGTPLVSNGDIVEAGDILVSGCLEFYNDSAEIIGYEYVTADADIYLSTTYEYTDTIALTYEDKLYSDTFLEKEFIKIGSYYVVAYKMNPLNYLYDVTNIETSWLSDQQNFWYLSIGKILYREYEIINTTYTDSEVQSILSTSFHVYCNQLIEKKVDIISNNVRIYIDEKNATAKGSIEVILENHATDITQIRENPIANTEEGTTE